MRIAITGSTGFIGRHLTEALLKRGDVVLIVGRDNRVVECDRIYHLACPSTNDAIHNRPTEVVDTILDVTRTIIQRYPNTLIVNASSMGAATVSGAGSIDPSPQDAYNVAKLCMETYLEYSGAHYINYRIPSVYGPGMADDAFIKRCVDGNAYRPFERNRLHYIAHIDDVVQSLIELKPIVSETITLGDIYEQFTSGRRGLHRPTPRPPFA